jgi:6-pyruvoyltetrahydropterin/6-carboxytetrahydropterin synthase
MNLIRNFNKKREKMPKYQIIKEFWIDIGHRMFNHDLLANRGASLLQGKESSLGWTRYKDIHPHGHTLIIQIVLESEELDVQGMSIDTDKVKRVIKEFMDKYDHSFLISKDDPVKDAFLELFKGCRIIVMDKTPTAEVIAEEIYHFFDKRFRELLPPDEYPNSFKIAEVRIKTAHTASSVYKP